MTKKELIEENKRLMDSLRSLVIYSEDTIPTYIHWKTVFQMQYTTDQLRWGVSLEPNQNFDGFLSLINKQVSPKNK